MQPARPEEWEVAGVHVEEGEERSLSGASSHSSASNQRVENYDEERTIPASSIRLPLGNRHKRRGDSVPVQPNDKGRRRCALALLCVLLLLLTMVQIAGAWTFSAAAPSVVDWDRGYQTSFDRRVAFGGCTFSGYINGSFQDAPFLETLLVRDGPCPAQAGTLDLSNMGITVVPANVFKNLNTTSAKFFALIAARPSFASISTRDSAAVGSACLPTYNALGGPQGKGHVTFNRIMSQYLDAGQRTLNIATNGGLTIVAVVRFRSSCASAKRQEGASCPLTGTPGNSERIIDLGSGQNANNLLVARVGTTTNLTFQIRNNQSIIATATVPGAIVQNSWLTVVVTYRANDMLPSSDLDNDGIPDANVEPTIWLRVKNASGAEWGAGSYSSHGTASEAVTDRTVSATYIGKGHWSQDEYSSDEYSDTFISGMSTNETQEQILLRQKHSSNEYYNGDVAGVFVVDEYLSTDSTSAIADAMVRGEDLTDKDTSIMTLQGERVAGTPISILSRKMTALNLAGNELTTLPSDVFSELSDLKMLRLRSNSLTVLLADVFSGLSNLMSLDVSRNMLSDLLPGVFTGLSNLESLVLTYNKFHHLPPVLSDLTALTVLDVSEGNHDGIWTDYQGGCIFAGNYEGAPLVRAGSCPQLEVLDLSYRGINQLPEDSFHGMSSLRTLNLGSNNLTTLSTGVFSDLSSLSDLDLSNNMLNTLPADVFSGRSDLSALNLAGNRLRTLPESVFSNLSALSDLDLGNNTLTTLPAGVFFDLSSLSALNLGINTLTMLPAGVFSHLSALKLLRLRSNSLTELRSDVFSRTYNVPLHELVGLNNLMFLDVSQNMLSDLPPGVFTGLSNLTSLVLTYNKFHHLPPVLSDLTALTVLDVSEGNHDGIWTEYQGWCIFAGNYEGAPLVRAGSCPQLEVLDLHYLSINQLPEDAFRGMSSLRALNLGSNALTTLPAGVFSDLSALSDLDLGINTLTKLPSYVFSGLRNLSSLNLARNQLTTLPADVFSDLSFLSDLDLGSNTLTTLPAGVFSELSALKLLRLRSNSFTELRSHDFSGLDNLMFLDVSQNMLSDLPPAVFNGLSNLEFLVLTNNKFHHLPPVLSDLTALTVLDVWEGNHGGIWTEYHAGCIFAGNYEGAPLVRAGSCPNLEVLNFTFLFSPVQGELNSSNTSCPSDCSGHGSCMPSRVCLCETGYLGSACELQSGGAYQVAGGFFPRRGINQLPEDSFHGMSSLRALDLGNNNLTTMPAGVFSDLSALSDLNLVNNALNTLPAYVFSGLSVLRTLNLGSNALTTLAAGVFSDLSALSDLDLDNNTLTTLPAGVFSKLSALKVLRLRSNSLTELRSDVFAGLDNLMFLDVSRNMLSDLPRERETIGERDPGIFTGLSNLEFLVLTHNKFHHLPPVLSDLTALTVLDIWEGNHDGIWTKYQGGCIFSGNYEGAPLVRAGSCPNLEMLDLSTVESRVIRSSVLSEAEEKAKKLEEEYYALKSSLSDIGIGLGSPRVAMAMMLRGRDEMARRIGELQTQSAVMEAELNLVEYNGNLYRTLDGTSPHDTNVSCQDYYLALPSNRSGIPDVEEAGSGSESGSGSDGGSSGWALAADNADSLHVIRSYLWGTHAMVLVNGRAFRTLAYDPGSLWGTSGLSKSGAKYMVSACNLRILISKPVPKRTWGINELPEDSFHGMRSLRALNLGNNKLTTLPAGVFSVLSALSDLDLAGNRLATLPAEVFSDLSALSDLDLANNTLNMMTLPAGVFSKLSALKLLRLRSNSLTELRSDVFAGLNNLMSLDVSQNMLSDLPPGVFTGLSNLTSLVLTYNKFRHLPPVLSDLTALTVLDVWEGNHDGIWTEYQGGCIFSGNYEGAPLVRAGSCPDLEVLDFFYLDINKFERYQGVNQVEVIEEYDVASRVIMQGELSAVKYSKLDVSRTLDGTLQFDTKRVINKGELNATNFSCQNYYLALPSGRVDKTGTLGADNADSLQVIKSYRWGTHVMVLAGTRAYGTPAFIPGSLWTLCGPLTTVKGKQVEYNGNVYRTLDGNEVEYKGRVYRTLDGTSPLNTSYHGQSSFLALPSGWALAADNTDSRDVIGQYRWGTCYVILKTGCAYKTLGCNGSSPNLWQCGLLSTSGPTYAATGTGDRAYYDGKGDVLILISKPVSTRTTWAINQLPEDSFHGMSSLRTLDLGNNNLTTMPAGVFSDLSALSDLNLANNALNTLPADVFSGLSVLRTLNLGSNALTTLAAGVFSDLSALSDLDLANNTLTTLPAGVFSNLSALKVLRLRSNSLTELRSDVFAGLDNLTFIDVSLNMLSDLPPGVFTGLSNLTSLVLTYNKFRHLPPVLSDLTALTVLDVWEGNHDDIWTEYQGGCIFSGNYEGAPLVRAGSCPNLDGRLDPFTRNSRVKMQGQLNVVEYNGNLYRTLDGTSPLETNVYCQNYYVSLPSGWELAVDNADSQHVIRSYSWGTHAMVVGSGRAYGTLAFNPGSLFTTLGLSKSGAKYMVTGCNLRILIFKHWPRPNLEVLDLSYQGINQLPEDSFHGMSSLRTLNLGNNALTTLAAELRFQNHEDQGVFSDLSALSDLDLANNTLTTLPAGVFSKLSALKLLRLRSNSLTELRSDVFAGLNNLMLLDVSRNMLSDLPPGVFTGLSNLTSLVLTYNKFRHLPPVLSDLTALTVLYVWEGNHDGIWTKYQGGCIFSGNYEGAPLVRAGSCPNLAMLEPSTFVSRVIMEAEVNNAHAHEHSHMVEYNGNLYRTLDGTSPLDTNVYCQNYFLSLPSGWALAADNADSLYVIRAYNWGTHVMVVAGGRAYGTLAFNPGSLWTTSGLSTSGSKYMVNGCNFRILISKKLLVRPNLEVLDLSYHSITQLPEDSFRGMSSLRTLNLGSNALTTLAAGVFSDLSALSDLDLANNTLTTLPAGVLSNLSALKVLRLRSNSLTELRSDVFAGLKNLMFLDVSQNMLSDLPPGVFTGLSNLTSLVLTYNKFRHLPPVLSDLTALTVLDVWEGSRCGVGYFASMSNATATACQTCVPGFSTNGQGASACETARQATIIRGSPPGNHDGIWTEYQGGCIFAGNYEGAPLVRAGSCPNLEVLDFSYQGINKFEIYTGINQFPLTEEYGVVSRVITDAQLSAVEYYGNLYMTLDGTSPLDTNVSCQNYFLSLPPGWALAADNADSQHVIRSYRWGTHAMVVAGGRAYGTLAFKAVPRSSPPPPSEPLSPGSLWTTSGLSTSGTKYRANGCNLRILIFKPVSARRPWGITQLPEDSFHGMSSLRTLKLGNNALTMLAAGVFSDLSALSDLNLAGTGLTTLPADVFFNISALSDLNLGINNLTTLPAGVFSNLSALSALNLAGNVLTTLPAGVFSQLRALRALHLNENNLTTLPVGVFYNLSALRDLKLGNNSLTRLSVGVFSSLSALSDLSIGYNKLTTLPLCVFFGLNDLRNLDVDKNPALECLPLIEDEHAALTSYSGPETLCKPTTLPWFICPCHEATWREYNDPFAPRPAMVEMEVQLPYAAQNFTGALQEKFKEALAKTAHVNSKRVEIKHINTTQANAVKVRFSIRVPQDKRWGWTRLPSLKAEEIRGALNLSRVNARLSENGMGEIDLVLQAAVVVQPSRVFTNYFNCTTDTLQKEMAELREMKKAELEQLEREYSSRTTEMAFFTSPPSLGR